MGLRGRGDGGGGEGGFSGPTLNPHCIPTVSSLYPHCTLTVPSLYPHCSLSVPPLYPHCTPTIPPLYPHCTPTVSSLYPHCTLTVPYFTLTVPLLILPLLEPNNNVRISKSKYLSLSRCLTNTCACVQYVSDPMSGI